VEQRGSQDCHEHYKQTDRLTHMDIHRDIQRYTGRDTQQSRCLGTARQLGLPPTLHTHTDTHAQTYIQTDRQTYTDTQAEIHSKVGA